MARFVTISPDMSEAVIQHLRNNFFVDEPLNKAVSLCERGQPHAALEGLCAATMADGLSIAAMEGDTQSLEKIHQSSDEKFNKIFTILYTVSQDLDLFNTYQLFKADATGAYSQRVCLSLGMRAVRSVRYSEYRDARGPVFTVPPPHDALAVMLREIP
ncbi:unnamed protein product [Chrysodeixis includens]|uniref:Uncharacterized protein n=1 Tax=Chrysodeixis includens TaxID=689277 RepID=A0A9N8KRB0_CHRIL|nr:unnamed protein product [Chrysodeixis includens]